MIFVKKFLQPQFWQQEFYAKNLIKIYPLGLKLFSISRCFFKKFTQLTKEFTRPPVPLVPPNINSAAPQLLLETGSNMFPAREWTDFTLSHLFGEFFSTLLGLCVFFQMSPQKSCTFMFLFELVLFDFVWVFFKIASCSLTEEGFLLWAPSRDFFSSAIQSFLYYSHTATLYYLGMQGITAAQKHWKKN